jgi:hypothetical protein
MIEKEAPGGDLKPYWLRWRRSQWFPRAEEGKRESSSGRGEECRTKVNRAWQMTLFFSRFANELKKLYSCAASLFITDKGIIYIYIRVLIKTRCTVCESCGFTVFTVLRLCFSRFFSRGGCSRAFFSAAEAPWHLFIDFVWCMFRLMRFGWC